MKKKPLKILVIRNDKLGDFMLAWPAFSLLKQQYPESEITALVPEYTAEIAKQCEWIDKVLIDTKQASFGRDILALSKKIKKNNFDTSISFFSEARTSIALWLSGLPNRIGPATKLAQLFLNKKLKQKRSQSAKPEYEYNIDLVKYYFKLNGVSTTFSPTPVYLKYTDKERLRIKNKYLKFYNIPKKSKTIFIHPGTGGSATNLSQEQYAILAKNISKFIDVFFVITSGPGEVTVAKNLSSLMMTTPHCIHQSTHGIVEFSKFLLLSELFIGGSTGPSHLAGALDLKTATFYPSHRSATALRWQTINNRPHRLAITPENNNMQSLKLDVTAKKIVDFLLIAS